MKSARITKKCAKVRILIAVKHPESYVVEIKIGQKVPSIIGIRSYDLLYDYFL